LCLWINNKFNTIEKIHAFINMNHLPTEKFQITVNLWIPMSTRKCIALNQTLNVTYTHTYIISMLIINRKCQLRYCERHKRNLKLSEQKLQSDSTLCFMLDQEMTWEIKFLQELGDQMWNKTKLNYWQKTL